MLYKGDRRRADVGADWGLCLAGAALGLHRALGFVEGRSRLAGRYFLRRLCGDGPAARRLDRPGAGPPRLHTGSGLTALSHFGFALFADGFWSALLLRLLAGIGWAGTYMPDLK